MVSIMEDSCILEKTEVQTSDHEPQFKNYFERMHLHLMVSKWAEYAILSEYI
jgi:hypothetical protein